MKYNRVLSIAGSDSGGGAGIQADIKAISACGAYAATAITAVTVQNTLGVTGVHPIPTDIIAAQIDVVMGDIGADAIKIGMLHSAEVVEVVCSAIDRYKPRFVVVDPVMVSTSGHRLIEDSAVKSLTERLIPRATIITPNLPEAEVILGRAINGAEDMVAAAAELSEMSGVAVLLKAGHLSDNVLTDILYLPNGEVERLSGTFVDTPNKHGTGCTLSSSIAAYLAQGHGVVEAVKFAKRYLTGALESGANYKIGGGHGPVNHMWNLGE